MNITIRRFLKALAGLTAFFALPRFAPANRIQILPAPLRPSERFKVEVIEISPEALAGKLYGSLDDDDELEVLVDWSKERENILKNRIGMLRAVIVDHWSNPAQHMAIESPQFEPTGRERARRILDECCDYVMKVRTGEIPPIDPSVVSTPVGILK